MLNPTSRFVGLLALTLTALGAFTLGKVGAQTVPNSSSVLAMKAKPTPAPPKLPANVLATVDGKPITRDDVLGMFDMVHARPLIGEMLKDRVVENKARSLGVVISEAELQSEIQKTKEQIVNSQMQRGTPITYEAFAKQQGISDMFLRWSVYEETLRKDTFIKAMQANIQPLSEQIKVAHILLATVPLGGNETPAKQPTAAEQDQKDADAKKKIDAIRADIVAGKITFADAAKANSADESNAKQGGELPYAAKGTFDPTFENAAWALKKVGDISEPVKSRFGWHLIKLLSIGANATPEDKKKYMDDQQKQIDAQAANSQQVQNWAQSLMAKANIVVNPNPVIVPNPKSPLTGADIAPAKKTK